MEASVRKSKKLRETLIRSGRLKVRLCGRAPMESLWNPIEAQLNLIGKLMPLLGKPYGKPIQPIWHTYGT